MLDTSGKVLKYMSKRINYTDAPADVELSLDDPIIIKDFLPPPSELIRKTKKRENYY